MVRKGKREKPDRHKQSLTDQLEDPETHGVRTEPRRKKPKPDTNQDKEGRDEKMTAKIMREARKQTDDVEAERDEFPLKTILQSQEGARSTADLDSDSEEDLEDISEFQDWNDEEIEVSPEDEAAMAAFLNPGAGIFKQRTLADIILDKIKEKQEAQVNPGQVRPKQEESPHIDPKVLAVYKGVGNILKRYTTGRLPKAFKIIPNLQNWEEILAITEPESWSPHAVYQATRLFVSNLNAKMAQRFITLILLPSVRDDIQENRRLHFALFQAVKKSTYRPDAFFKGFLLPLCQSGTCTLREAVIVSSVINRVSIPVIHSAAALLRLAGMPYAGTTSFFISVLLDKKYAMPYRVIDALVDHFLRFQTEERTLPVVWHQSLLVFVQRYKHEIRREDQQALMKLIKVQYHYQVSPEIHRELEAARSRGQKAMEVDTAKLSAKRILSSFENPRNLPPVIMMEE